MKQKRGHRRKSRGRRGRLWLLTLIGAGALVAALQTRGPSEPAPPPPPTQYGYRIVNVYPHAPDAFTQGLLFRDGLLFESTGLVGRSSLRKVRLETGEVLQQRGVEPPHFAEGLVDWDDRLIQLTWQSEVGFVYELESFTIERTFTYAGEGWGLTRDAGRIIMSDGTSQLRFLDPETLQEAGRLTVTEAGRPVTGLNELEMVKGEIFANVWPTDAIVIIAPEDGRVTGRVDLRGLLPAADRRPGVDVLNGIAYDAANDRLFVTGKQWPRLYEIRLEAR